MTVTVEFECGGCDEKAKGAKPLRRHFHSINGSGHGFGHWSFDGPQDVAPEGWVSFDPYTGCCYCPECWANIENTEAAEDQHHEEQQADERRSLESAEMADHFTKHPHG